jgi:hypothetical protein
LNLGFGPAQADDPIANRIKDERNDAGCDLVGDVTVLNVLICAAFVALSWLARELGLNQAHGLIRLGSAMQQATFVASPIRNCPLCRDPMHFVGDAGEANRNGLRIFRCYPTQ